MTIKELRKYLDKYPDDTKVSICNLFGRKVVHEIDEVLFDKVKNDILIFPDLNLD